MQLSDAHFLKGTKNELELSNLTNLLDQFKCWCDSEWVYHAIIDPLLHRETQDPDPESQLLPRELHLLRAVFPVSHDGQLHRFAMPILKLSQVLEDHSWGLSSGTHFHWCQRCVEGSQRPKAHTVMEQVHLTTNPRPGKTQSPLWTNRLRS